MQICRLMVLDVKFRKLLEKELEKILYSAIKEKNMKVKDIWKCSNQNDFLYGWYLAKADDFCINQYFTHYHKSPNQDDRDEIQGILFLHSKDLRDKIN